jgi:hypothetical protein
LVELALDHNLSGAAAKSLPRRPALLPLHVRAKPTSFDAAAQTAYLVTGEFREFTDASHPEVIYAPSQSRNG